MDRGGRVDGEAEARAARLNAAYEHHSAFAVMSRALTDPQVGEIALVSSFGAESVVLLHMLSVMDRRRPVLFLETGMLFPETLAYQREVDGRLGLTDVRLIRPDAGTLAARDPDGTLNARDADACCDIRKVRPLEAAIAPFDAWITGRKRFQGGQRAALQFFEADGPRLKVNPLAHWTPGDVADYMINNRLPRHPLVAQGYPSLGCAPCTTPVAAGEDPRAGRWRGAQKEECGIHFVDGRLVRGPVPSEAGPPAPAEETPMTDTTQDATRIARDDGFAPEDWEHGFAPAHEAPPDAPALDLASDADPAALADRLATARMIRVDFPSFADGRGFTIARRLRQMGYRGRLRARGVIADQYAMARRSGFDEVEVPPALAARQPEPQWRARADWRSHDYRARLRA
jgi:phosphoadenylyl-sulfate reductase (thioredoxin)